MRISFAFVPTLVGIDKSLFDSHDSSKLAPKVKYFGSTKHLSDFEIKYYYSDTKFVTLNLRPDRSLKIDCNPVLFDLMFSGELPSLLRKAIQRRSKNETIYGQIDFANVLKDLEEKINEIFEDYRIPQFIPASRNLTVTFPDQLRLLFFGSLSSGIGLLDRDIATALQPDSGTRLSMSVDIYLMFEFMKHVERVKERFNGQGFEGLIAEAISSIDSVNQAHSIALACDKVKQILKADYRLHRYGERLYYTDDAYVDLNDASSGQQESIRILQDLFLIVLDQAKVFRVIEEPEAHLYPMAQKHLIELISLMVSSTDSQVVVTTHSPYVLSIFNNLLYASLVVRKDQKLRDEVSKIVPELCWLKPESFNAYVLRDGIASSIFDKELGLIDQNALDEISDELGAEFDQMYALRAKVVS